MSRLRALNPNHPVVKEVEEQWYKLCAILLWKSGCDSVEITSEDIDRFMNSGKPNIAVHPQGKVLTLTLLSDAEGERLAREQGGLAH